MATVAVIAFGKVLSPYRPYPFNVRSSQNVASLPATSSGQAQDGEVAFVGNAGTSMITAAVGSTPVATTTTATSATSAAIPIGPGEVVVIPCHNGDSIAVAALS